MSKIHPTAIVSPKAEVGPDCEIGAYAIVEDDVILGARNRVLAHGIVCSGTRMGEENEVHYGAVIGHMPQHKHFTGVPQRTIVGNRNVFREYSQVHRGSVPGNDTTLGDGNLVMALAHVAHDCHLGNDVVLCNNSLLAGHVSVGDRAVISGNVGVHQFTQIGTLAMVGGASTVSRDVPPYMTAVGARPCLVTGLNTIGLRRAGLDDARRQVVSRAFRILYRSGLLLPDAIGHIAELGTPEALHLAEFLKRSKRGVLAHHRADEEEGGDGDGGEGVEG